MVWPWVEDALSNQFAQNHAETSFLRIPTMVKATEARGTVLDSVINRIVQQNIAAKVQPITSFGWASILKNFGNNSFEDALSAYNGHLEVLAHDHNDSGAGSIALDGRKKQGVRNWMERTSANAFVEVLRSTHDSVVMLVFGGGRISEPSSPI